MSEDVKTSRWLVIVLSLVPVWLAVSAGVAVWWSVSKDDQEEEERNQRFAMEMSVERIADDLRKLDQVIGARNLADETGRRGLTRAAAMLEGILGPSNTGYTITKLPGPEDYPLICAKLKSSNRDAPSIWVIAAYDKGQQDDPDSSPGAAATPTQASASATASLVAIAQAMNRDKLGADIHFMLVPHGHDQNSPVDEMVPILLNRFQTPARVFCISHMADTPELTALVPDTAKNSFTVPEDLALPLSTNLLGPTAPSAAKKGLPVVVVQTKLSGRADDSNPAQNIAISSGKLVEWLRRSARLEAAE